MIIKKIANSKLQNIRMKKIYIAKNDCKSRIYRRKHFFILLLFFICFVSLLLVLLLFYNSLLLFI